MCVVTSDKEWNVFNFTKSFFFQIYTFETLLTQVYKWRGEEVVWTSVFRKKTFTGNRGICQDRRNSY